MTIIEFMISIAVGLVLVAGITTLIVQQSGTQTELEKSTRQIENGRYASKILQDDIQLAGYYGEYSDALSAPAALPDPCATTPAAIQPALALHIQGYDSPATVDAPLSACLANENHVPGTDILVTRRADTTPVPVASAEEHQIYLQTGIDPTTRSLAYRLDKGVNKAVFDLQNYDGSLAGLRKFLVHIYFVSPCNSMNGTTCNENADGGAPIPTLKRLELGVTGAVTGFNLVPLVDGIENLQLDHGIDTNNDGAPEAYKTDPSTANDWSNVMTVQLNLLARNNEPSRGYKDTKRYRLGMEGEITAPNDAFKRHVFTQLVRANNPGGRREK